MSVLLVVVFSVEAVVAVVAVVVGSALIVVVEDMVVGEGYRLVVVPPIPLVVVVAESRFVSLCTSLNKTNPHMPRPRSVQRMRITTLELNLHLWCFRVDTCCPLIGLTG